LSDSGLEALAPDLVEGLGMSELAVGTPLAAVLDDPQEQSVVDCSQLLVVFTIM